MRQKKIGIMAVIILALLFIFGFYTYDSFRHKGIDQALIGQVEEDRYPAWDNWNDSTKISGLDYDIVDKSNLRISEIYFIQRAKHYQIRLRIAAGMPFCHPDLMEETDWVVEDSSGSSYASNLVVYAEEIGGLNCVNLTLVLNEDEFSRLSGKELYLTAVCSEDREEASVENSYAHCQMKIVLP